MFPEQQLGGGAFITYVSFFHRRERRRCAFFVVGTSFFLNLFRFFWRTKNLFFPLKPDRIKFQLVAKRSSRVMRKNSTGRDWTVATFINVNETKSLKQKHILVWFNVFITIICSEHHTGSINKAVCRWQWSVDAATITGQCYMPSALRNSSVCAPSRAERERPVFGPSSDYTQRVSWRYINVCKILCVSSC